MRDVNNFTKTKKTNEKTSMPDLAWKLKHCDVKKRVDKKLLNELIIKYYSIIDSELTPKLKEIKSGKVMVSIMQLIDLMIIKYASQPKYIGRTEYMQDLLDEARQQSILALVNKKYNPNRCKYGLINTNYDIVVLPVYFELNVDENNQIYVKDKKTKNAEFIEIVKGNYGKYVNHNNDVIDWVNDNYGIIRKGGQAFSFFTTLIHNAFLQVILKENSFKTIKFEIIKDELPDECAGNDFRTNYED